MDHEETSSGSEKSVSVPSVQLARYSYFGRDSYVSSSKRVPKQRAGFRKVAASKRRSVLDRENLIRSGKFAKYDLRVVSRGTVIDPERTKAMAAEEQRLWNRCEACHKDYGVNVYRFYLAKRIEHLEMQACWESGSEDSTGSFVAIRRMVAILVQERIMLDMKDAALRAVGFDGAFIALGRCVRMRGFKKETGWYTERELHAYRAARRSAREDTKPQTDNLADADV